MALYWAATVFRGYGTAKHTQMAVIHPHADHRLGQRGFPEICRALSPSHLFPHKIGFAFLLWDFLVPFIVLPNANATIVVHYHFRYSSKWLSLDAWFIQRNIKCRCRTGIWCHSSYAAFINSSRQCLLEGFKILGVTLESIRPELNNKLNLLRCHSFLS